MSYGGILVNPGKGSGTGAASPDPRDRGYGAAPMTAGGGGGASQPGAAYTANPNGVGGGLSAHHALIALVLGEMLLLCCARRAFKDYHGG